jgi:hypothetical protein
LVMPFVDTFLVITELRKDTAATVIWCGEEQNDIVIDYTLSWGGRCGWLKANCNIPGMPGCR